MDTYTHAPAEYNRQGFVWDIPKLLVGPPVSHPSDPWKKRTQSVAPEDQPHEAHLRIGDHAHAGEPQAELAPGPTAKKLQS
jgi:NADH-quinone oxidoreductase subunit I